MKRQIKSIFLFLTVLSMFFSVQGAYAGWPIEMGLDYGDYYKESSWFQPHIDRKEAGGTYTWTVTGTVWFSKDSSKWPGYYWESGGYTPPIWYLPLRRYASPYIAHVQIHMTAARIDPKVSVLNLNEEPVDAYTQDIVIENNTIIKNEFKRLNL